MYACHQSPDLLMLDMRTLCDIVLSHTTTTTHNKVAQWRRAPQWQCRAQQWDRCLKPGGFSSGKKISHGSAQQKSIPPERLCWCLYLMHVVLSCSGAPVAVALTICYASTWCTCQILFLLLLLYLNHDSFVRWLTYAADTVMTPSTFDSLTYDSSH